MRAAHRFKRLASLALVSTAFECGGRSALDYVAVVAEAGARQPVTSGGATGGVATTGTSGGSGGARGGRGGSTAGGAGSDGGTIDASWGRGGRGATPDGGVSDASEEPPVACDPNPTPTTCRGNVPQYCDSSGQWRDRPTGVCPADAPACRSGSCIVVPKVNGLAVGLQTTCAVFANGKLKCWGMNAAGQLGLGDDQDRGDQPGELVAMAPIDLGTARLASAATVNVFHACALLDRGDVKCWGAAGAALGTGDNLRRGSRPDTMGDALPVVALGSGRSAIAVAAGPDRTCALLDHGDLKCWGNVTGDRDADAGAVIGDHPGDLGDNLPPIDFGPGRSVKTVTLGIHRTCVILDNGELKCWGQNQYGELGLGTNASFVRFAEGLPSVNLGTGRTAKAVAARGINFTCAILDNGQVKCWGANDAGELGQGDDIDRGTSADQMGDNLPPIDLGTGRTAKAIDTGVVHACALLDDDSLKCWGQNVWGQLGMFTGERFARGKWPGEMGDDLPAVALGTGRHAMAVVTGHYHTCALLDDGTVKCWGGNQSGQLGLGDTRTRGDMPGDMGDNLPMVPLW